jgi:hypothetical protein
MTLVKTNARFSYNNYLDASTIETSGTQSSYPVTNLFHPIRSKLWKASNLYEIHEKNCNIYINGTTYTVDTGSYTFAQLKTKIETACASQGLTLSQGSGDRIIISFLADKTLNISNQTDAIWFTLGFLGTTNRTGSILSADERRYNTGAWIKVDLGMPQDVDFAALLAPAGETFACDTATIRLQGNNLDLWQDDMPVDQEFEVSGDGAFFSGTVEQPCRFWRIFIDDRTNNAIQAAVGFMGSSVIPVNTNIATGFSRSREDTSIKLVSENGTFYIDRRPKVLSLSSISVQLLKDDELMELEQLFYDLGIEKPFFLSIDPKKQVSQKLSQMTHYVAVTSPLQLQHVLRGYYNLSIELREVV